MNKTLIIGTSLFLLMVGCDGTIAAGTVDQENDAGTLSLPVIVGGSAGLTEAAVQYARGRGRRRDAGGTIGTDGGSGTTPTADAGVTPTPTPVDAGSTTTADAGSPSALDAGSPSAPDGGATSCVGAGCTCVRATDLWHEDFETGDYSRWTGGGYGNSWGDACQSNGFTTAHPHAGGRAHRSEIVCASNTDGIHRGYGGIQFSGSDVLPRYTNTGTGVVVPNGIVNTFWIWLEAGYSFGSGRWMSPFTVNPTCGYTERVITLGIDQPDGIVRPAHYWPEGTLTMDPGATAMPRGQWVRITLFLNFNSGEMHAWQNGRSLWHVRGIVRATKTMCQFHWGLYASGDNTDVVIYEDDNRLWRLEQPWTDWSREPWLGATQSVCP